MNPLIGIAAAIFPEILKVVAGDKAGTIAEKVAKSVTEATGANTPEAAKTRIDGDPKVAADLQVRLAQIALDAQAADLAAAEKARQDALERDRIALDNTSRARAALLDLINLGGPIPWTPSIISYIVVLGFLILVFLLMFGKYTLPETSDTFVQIINICIGAIAAGFATVINFWLGSSLGSRSKDGVFARESAGRLLVPTVTQSSGGPKAPSLPASSVPVSPVSPAGPSSGSPGEQAPSSPTSQEPPATTSPAGPFGQAPPWFKWALHEIGTREEPENHGAALARYRSLAHAGEDGDPWCAIFVNAALEANGVLGARSASSQSFRSNPNFVRLPAPAVGALAVFWRGSKTSGLGHVGFYRGENASRVWTLGGNEDDMVQIEALPKDSAKFGLIGYWWPKGFPIPATGPISMPSDSPRSIRVDPSNETTASDGRQAGITATMFGGAGDSETNAYTGQPVDPNVPGVALPFRFPGERPRVRVSNPRKNLHVDADIVDVGPWNTNDPYWEMGTRPQAESGVDKTGRRTNRAGIDLTLAAAQAIEIDGKGLVDWEFVTPPSAAHDEEPKVT
jgi:uncharacterized protein (TIGR02594 family)